MKKLVIFTILMMGVSVANAAFLSNWGTKAFFKPAITLPAPAPAPAPEIAQINTEKNVYVQAINDHEEGGYKEQKEGNVGAVPVPAALPLMASALCIFGIARRRSIHK
ncbi:MAG: hypothetical protein ACO1N8_00790 [Methylophilus sp.]